jgi:hypothetical protein
MKLTNIAKKGIKGVLNNVNIGNLLAMTVGNVVRAAPKPPRVAPTHKIPKKG